MESTKLKNGRVLYHHDKGDYIADEIIKERNFFESGLLKKLKKIIGNTKINNIVEIGANIGNHVAWYEDFLGPNLITAYEPLEENIKILNKNSSKIVEIKKYGLGKRNEILKFYVDEKNYGASSVEDKYKKNYSKEVSVKIKNILKEKSFDNADLIKMDIEGAEENMLSEVVEKFSLSAQFVMIEINYNLYDNIGKMYEFISKMRKHGMGLIFIENYDFIFKKCDYGFLDSKIKKIINFDIRDRKVKELIDAYRKSLSKTEIISIKKTYKKLIRGKKISLRNRFFWFKIIRILTLKTFKSK